MILTWGLAAVLGSSFAACALLILTQKWHGSLSLDHDLSGVQKIHQAPVPRIGGLGLAIGLMMGAMVGIAVGGTTYPLVLQLLACAAPVFLAGLIEDLTKRVSVKTRLYASFASAGIAAWALDAHLMRLDTPILDTLIVMGPVSVLFTCFAVAGITHAVNIVDGLNGLAAGCVALMLAGLALIAWQVNDLLIFKLCLWGIAALLGFLVFNFPFGRIFLGDGGAYLSGFWLAECGILLLNRNPSVSTWAVLLCCIYPFWETVFSIYRRHILHRVSSGRPDMIHLHHLIYRHIARRRTPLERSIWLKHGVSSMVIWLMASVCVVLAAHAYNDTPVLMLSALSFVVLYNATYRYIQRNGKTASHAPEPLIGIERP